MSVCASFTSSAKPFVSFEIIPPLRGEDIKPVLKTIEELIQYQPPFIDVTSHAAIDNTRRKRPGTLGICALLQYKYNTPAVPHVLCHGFTREETEDFLLELHYLGIDTVLALQGDGQGRKVIPPERSSNTYAVDLVQQIVSLNKGAFLSARQQGTPTNFSIGVAGYPEKHYLAPDLDTDISYLKAKIDAGASYVVTQMFFDNQQYFSYVARCRAAGITVPIVPGLKVLTNKKQIESLSQKFALSLPQDLLNAVRNSPPQDASHIGVEWAVQQIKELYRSGVPGVHLYVMLNTQSVHEVIKRI